MRKLVFLLLVFISTLHAEQAVRLAADSEPLLTVANCVSLTDGSFFHVSQDFSIDGPMPLTYTRHYDGGFFDEALYKYNHHGYGVSLGYPLHVRDQESHHGKKKRTFVDQRENFGVRFNIKHMPGCETGRFHDKMFKWGYTNCTDALERGVPSLAHTVLYRSMKPASKNWDYEVVDLDQTRRFYTYDRYDSDAHGNNKRYTLQRTEHPNGLSTHYFYDQQGQLEKVCLKNTLDQEELTSLSISYNQPHTYSVYGSDGRGVTYHQTPLQGRYKDEDILWTNYLFRMTGHDVPEANYTFTTPKRKSIPLMNSISAANGRFLNVEYTKTGQVRSLNAPLDDTGLPRRLYLFKYHHKGEKVEVVDALGRGDCYYLSDKKRLRYKNEARKRIHDYQWDKHGQLICKFLRDARFTREVVEAISYKYTPQGNIAEKWEQGVITGDDSLNEVYPQGWFFRNFSIRKYLYEYGACNTLKKQQNPNGLVTQYKYKPGTNLLVAKLEGPAGAIEKRQFYTYDKNAILIEKIEDDGSGSEREDLTDVSYRRITRITPQMDRSLFGLTKPAVEELTYLDLSTGEEVLLKRIETDYVQGGHVGEKRTYDSTGTLAYHEICRYNYWCNLEGICDRRGCWTRFGYDENLNINHIDCPEMGKQIYKKYDHSNRLTEEKEVHEDGTVLITTHTYDLMSNKTSTTDPEGFKTQFVYDELYRKIKEIDPYGAEMTVEYDIQDNPIVKTDKEANTTHTKYNIDHQPLHITHPDGSVEEFCYYLDGTLRRKKEKDGSFVEFTYNVFGKILTECRLDQEKHLLTKKSYFYKGENLVAEIDPEGIITTYTYDGAGRCTSKSREGIAETYGYDTLGRRDTVQRGQKIIRQIFDTLDRVVEERIEDLYGQVYRKTLQFYDNHGNVTKKQIFTDEHHYIETTTHYNSCNLPILQMDGMGNATTFHYNHAPFQKITTDPLGRQTIESYDAFQRIICKEMPGLSKQEAIYSPNGHRIKQIDHIYQQGVEKERSTVAWEYDFMGNMISLVEKDLKKTKHTYLNGRLYTTKKPDGITLYHRYDPLGKLIEQSSSDGTLSTHYTYDLNGNILSVIDQTGSRVERTYDAQNNITSETTHTTIYYSYDELNRVTEIYFPDSTTNYTYNPADLVSIERHNKTHAYLYDLAGRLLQEDTFDSTTTFYSYDDNSKLTAIISPHYIHTLEYDPVGNVVRTIINDQTTNYTYDPLHQLTSENTTTYTYDSLYNRLSKDNHTYQYNPLKQVVSDNENIYTYDPNGNRLTKNGITYTYDALNRLTSAGEISYTYDPLGRLQSRTSPTTQEHYLYYKENELGTTNNLKILGRGIAGLEQNGQLYTVINDHRGSPTLILLDTIPVATYHYSAFGETTHTGTIDIPWQYTSHRCDPQTKLLHAPKRVYDPSLGQWLTPDPLGFADGPNPYAYVHNNPLIFIDPTGLFKAELCRFFTKIFNTVLNAICNNLSCTLFETTWGGGETSSNYTVRSSTHQPVQKGGVNFIPGICTRHSDAVSNVHYLGEINGGYDVDLTHTATRGLLVDAFGYIADRLGFSGESDKLLHKKWDAFFANADPYTPYLQKCHSRGVVQVRNALMSYPQELRKRIIVVAIAPGAYIDRSLCMKVTHYVTNGDLVTWLDFIGRFRCREDITVLKSQTRTGFMDHSFQSKTYERAIAREYLKYKKMVEK